MTTWVLVIVLTVGALGRGGVTMQSVAGFANQEECRRAGETVKLILEGGLLKELRYVCVIQTEQRK